MSDETKKIIFDLDGVIINSEPTWKLAMEYFLDEIGQEKASKAFNKMLTGVSEEEAAKAIKEEYLLKQSVDEIKEMREGIVRDLHAIETVLFPGAFKLLLDLEDAGITTALTTSSSSHIVDYVLSKFSLRPYFDYVVTGDEIKQSKPHPQIYLETAKRMNTEPGQCIAIEDSVNGLKAAKAAGMKAIAVLHDGDFSEKELLRYKPEKVVKRIKDIDIKKIKKL